MWNRDSPVSNVSLHWWPRHDWSSTGLRPPNCRLALMPTMWQCHLFSHSFPVPVSRSLQVSLLASQPTESAAGGEPCGEPAISHDSHHVSLVQWTNLFASCHRGHRFKTPGGDLCETGILLIALSRYSTSLSLFLLKFRWFIWLLLEYFSWYCPFGDDLNQACPYVASEIFCV
jgi:hypothetical protein